MQLHSSVTRPVNCTGEGYLKILIGKPVLSTGVTYYWYTRT